MTVSEVMTDHLFYHEPVCQGSGGRVPIIAVPARGVHQGEGMGGKGDGNCVVCFTGILPDCVLVVDSIVHVLNRQCKPGP